MEPKFNNKQILKEFRKHAHPFRKMFFASFILMFSTLFFDLSRPFLLKMGLDKITTKDMDGLYFILYIFLIFIVFDYLSRSAFNYFINIAFLKTVSGIREAAFAHVIKLKMAYFDRQPVGALLTRTVNDIESLSNSLRSGIATVFVDFFTVIGILIVMTQINLQLSPVIMITVPIIIFTVRWFGNKLRSWYLIVRKKLANSNAFMAEGISGAEIIQLFNHHEESNKQFTKINKDYERATISTNLYDASLYAVMDGLAAVTIAAILYWGLGYHFSLIEVSIVIVYIDLVEKIFVPLRDLSGKFATIQQSLAALQRVFALLHTPAIIPPGTEVVSPQDLTIHFENVSFKYKEDGPQILENINFKVNPGQVIALVGTTGSGKSTIGRLFTRTYDGYEGKIYIDQTEISKISNLRSLVSAIHQDVTLFPITIRENITLNNPNITEEDVLNAIAIARVDKWVYDLPGNLDFAVKENATNLSSGQAQLIVFARAMAHNTPIILMDEATANIDSITEKWIQEALDEIFKRKTVVVIAHRLSTISKADNILVIKNGKIMEQGKHDELMQKQGYYAELILSAEEQVIEDAN